MAPHFLLLLLSVSSLCLGRKKEKTHIVSNTEKDRRFKIKTKGVEKKGYDYQIDDKDDSIDSDYLQTIEDSDYYPDSDEVNETTSK